MAFTKETCPYCGNTDCEADWVDVAVGYVQCGPYYCHECGSCEIGPNDRECKLSDEEEKSGWYRPENTHNTSAPTANGVIVDHQTAKRLYEFGMLDPFFDSGSNDL